MIRDEPNAYLYLAPLLILLLLTYCVESEKDSLSQSILSFQTKSFESSSNIQYLISNIQHIDFWHSVISIRHLMQRHSLSSPHPIYFTLVVTTFSTCPGLNYLFIWFFLNRIVSAFTLARVQGIRPGSNRATCVTTW
ncbi:hypothetical protein EDC96DRAFT_569535 [Choanephora cucurbitarum]|nr:hypothetical protein EDC96DRAFT_569535 [Choanephora cucurbitarum]